MNTIQRAAYAIFCVFYDDAASEETRFKSWLALGDNGQAIWMTCALKAREIK